MWVRTRVMELSPYGKIQDIKGTIIHETIHQLFWDMGIRNRWHGKEFYKIVQNVCKHFKVPYHKYLIPTPELLKRKPPRPAYKLTCPICGRIWYKHRLLLGLKPEQVAYTCPVCKERLKIERIKYR